MRKYININFDDVHPETSKHIADCGGDMEKGVFKYILKLIEDFPKVRITLFVTPNWIDKPNNALPIKLLKRALGMRYTNRWNDEPFRLDKHKEWCAWLNEFVRRGNIEVAVHGLHHHRDSDPHSAEFLDLPFEECKSRLLQAESIFEISGLRYVKGFRPPGWGISEGLFKALRELGYIFVSLDEKACKLNLPRYEISEFKGLVNIPQNWDIKRGSVEEAFKILEKGNILSIKGHIQDKYGGDKLYNGLTEESYENIRNLLIKIEEEGINVRYAKMEEIAYDFRGERHEGMHD